MIESYDHISDLTELFIQGSTSGLVLGLVAWFGIYCVTQLIYFFKSVSS